MADSYETEFKVNLASEADYEALQAALPPPIRDIDQHNLFLDTADGRLAAGRWALRLRLEVDRATGQRTALLAVKGPSTRVAGAVHRPDIECPLEPTLWDVAHAQGGLHPAELDGPPVAFLQRQVALDPHAALEVFAAFENRRTSYSVTLAGEPREILLDRTRFATGEVDHEVEVEVSLPDDPQEPASRLELGAVKRDLDRLLAKAGLTPAPAKGGKLSRCLAYAGR